MGLDAFDKDDDDSTDSDQPDEQDEVVESDGAFPPIENVEQSIVNHARNSSLDIETKGPRVDANKRDLAMLFIQMCLSTKGAHPENIDTE